MIYKIKTSVINGKIKRNATMVMDALNSFEGKDIEITIEKAKKKRSNSQNAFYHGVVVVLVKQGLKEQGMILSNNNVHDLLRLRFLKETIPIGENGEYIERVKSTTELSTSQFMDYLAEITQFGAEYLGVDIPEPNEITTLQFND